MNEFYTLPLGIIHHILTNKLSQTVTSLSAGQLAHELVDLSGLIENAVGIVTEILPITHFSSIEDVERLANHIELKHPIGPANVWSEMSGIFYELALNSVHHAQSVAGCYVTMECAEVAPRTTIYAVGVADCGIGIPASLRNNPAYAHLWDDTDAIFHATELHVTGTGDPTRGLGLDHIIQIVKDLRGNFTILSATGRLNIISGLTDKRVQDRPAHHLSGTVAVVTLSA